MQRTHSTICSLYLQASSRSAHATRCSVASGTYCSTCIHQQPGCAGRALKAALEAGHLPKKEEQGQGQGTAPLAAESSPEKPEAAKFFAPSKHN